ncbi:MAG: FAD-dependent oxidoreductase [Clostridia bacterium]|nr:FAD-dependent oxidoreductase [Clostridia bacterium]
MAFDSLFQPGRIGTMEVKNRLVMPPMSTRLASVNGEVTKELIAYYAERAKGGVGTIIVEYSYIDEFESKAAICQLGVQSDHHITGLNELAEAIQSYGAKAVLQLAHGGRQTDPGKMGMDPVGPSAIPDPLTSAAMGRPNWVRELDQEEIQEIIESFAEAARRTKMAGFDGVELHGAHGYLLCQFLSPFSNRRNDMYGGDLEGRARMPLETVDRVRSKVGKDYPILYRLSADEYVGGGLTLEETVRFAQMLEEAGVDCLHVSCGNFASIHRFVPPIYFKHGYFTYLAEEIKKAVNIPVIAVGAISEPEHANWLIEQGKADFVAMGRALIADPHLPSKARSGRLEEIRPCIRCNEGCINRFFKGWTMRCATNPQCGRELHYAEIPPAEKPSKVLIVGGGPSGMESAIVSAKRGHKVILCEKEGELGGLLRDVVVPEYKYDIKRLLNHWIYMVQNMDNIEIRLNTEVTPELVKEISPDVVFVAAGSREFIPPFPGSERPNVVSGIEVYAGRQEVGQKIVIAGGGILGCETAIMLAKQGKEVTVVEKLDTIAYDVEPLTQMTLQEMMAEHNVKILTGTALDSVVDEGAVIIDKELNKRILPMDNLVVAIGRQPNKEVVESLMGTAPQVIPIGDCVKAGDIADCTHQAFVYAVR